MLFDPRGRSVKTVEEAEEYIRSFIALLHDYPHSHAAQRSHDYDLYLPWLIEVVEYLPATECEPTPPLTLERLYMEAAWQLVQKGYLRPGPRKPNSGDLGEGYGKGYSLTFTGDEWIQSFPRTEIAAERLVSSLR